MTSVPESAALLEHLAVEQAAAERRMLACMTRSPEEFEEARINWRAPTIPVQLIQPHGQIFNALATIYEEIPKPVTPKLVDEVLRYFESEAALRLGGGEALWAWLPESGTARTHADVVAQLSNRRRDVGQRVWREALYRWFDCDRLLLYVGVSMDLGSRQNSHVKKSSFMQFAAEATVERYPTRQYSEWAERRAIKNERPLFNHQHNDTPEARRRLVEYLIEKGRTDLLLPAVSRG